MLISRTPLRVSFFGGGTDLPEFYRNHRGAVIGTAIDKYIYHTVSRFPSELFDYTTRISYSKVECVRSIDDIQHAPFREILRECGIQKDIEIHVAADLPSFSGLGSSSSFTVGLLKALYAFQQKEISPLTLTNEAIRIEREVLREAVGCQDQSFASFGGMNLISFSADNTITVEPLSLSAQTMEELSASLILFFTGITRRAANIEEDKIKRIDDLNANLKSMLHIVDDAYTLLTNNKGLSGFGALLDKAWKEKKALGVGVSNGRIDQMYQTAIDNGAFGGKLLGAGGGGFLLFFVPPENRVKLKKALSQFSEIPFSMNAPGATIIYS